MVNLTASLKKPLAILGKTLINLPDSVTGLLVRGDVCAEPDPAALREVFSGTLIYALRDKTAGGSFQGSPEQRRQRLSQAAMVYDLVELDEDLDLTPEVLARVPPFKRLVSWRGAALNLAELRALFQRLSDVPARYYLVAPEAKRIADGLPPLRLLRELKRTDVIAYATGVAGTWTRPLSAFFGSPMVFGSLAGAPGEITVSRLIRDFDLPHIRPITELFGIVGPDVSRSPSPRLHNAGYRALDRTALYLPFNAPSFSEFRQDCLPENAFADLGLRLTGLTVVAPYKEEALAAAPDCEDMAAMSGGANMMVRANPGWYAGTSDPSGILTPIKHIDLFGIRAAVLGCGGAGRAAIAALKHAGARVTLVNRNQGRGRLAATLLSVAFAPLNRFSPRGFSLIVNATPLGREGEAPPFCLTAADPNAVVLEYVLSKKPTPLITGAQKQGLVPIDGWEVLRAQIYHQFRFLSGQELPPDCMDNYLDKFALFQ